MKQLIGSDIGSYKFSPSTGEITFSGIPSIDLSNVLVITNVTQGVMLYSFADPTMGGSVTNNILTLEVNASSHSAADTLQIWIDLPQVDQLALLLRQLLDIANSPAGYDSAQQRTRMTTVLESGTVTTVTTCGTVSNVSQIDGRNGAMLINASDDFAWQMAVRSRIS